MCWRHCRCCCRTRGSCGAPLAINLPHHRQIGARYLSLFWKKGWFYKSCGHRSNTFQITVVIIEQLEKYKPLIFDDHGMRIEHQFVTECFSSFIFLFNCRCRIDISRERHSVEPRSQEYRDVNLTVGVSLCFVLMTDRLNIFTKNSTNGINFAHAPPLELKQQGFRIIR